MLLFAKEVFIILLLVFTLGLSLFVFSILFPRKWPFLDTLRLLYIQKPIITFISNIHYRSQINKKIIVSDLILEKHLVPGDLLFTSDTTSLGNIFIHGVWKHIALYLGTPLQLQSLLGPHSSLVQKIQNTSFDPHTPLIIESNFNGVQILPLTHIKPTEAFVGIRIFLAKQQLIQGIELIGSHIGKSYDFDFDLNNQESMYCSKIFYNSFIHRGLSPNIEIGNLRNTITPTSLLQTLLQYPHKKPKVHIILYLKSMQGTIRYASKKDLLKSI